MSYYDGINGKSNSRPVPEKIREGREARGFTLDAFAERLGVTKQAVAQYENGHIVPSGEVFRRIVGEVGQPISFFLAPKLRSGEPSNPFWRSLKRMESVHRRRVYRRLQWTSDILDLVNDYIHVPILNIPHLDFDPDGDHEFEKIELAAECLRDHWQLGRGPIRNLSIKLEENGLVIVREPVHCADMDGVSCWVRGRPFILLAKEVVSGPRDLFNLAHELGHIALHAGVDVSSDNLSRIERQANHFASAFLLPRESFSREVFGTSISHFTALKERWGVAIAAMAYRCKDLETISADQHSYIMRQMNARRIRAVEPLDDAFSVCIPQMLKEALTMIVNHGVCSRAQLESALSLNLRDVESLCGLEDGFLDDRIVKLEFRAR